MKVLDDLSLARKELKIADHMIYVTFNLLNDKTLISNVISHLKSALKIGIMSFLDFEYYKKNINALPKSDNLKTQLFLRDYSEELDLTIDDNEMINILDAFTDSDKHSFSRGNNFYFLNDNFAMRSIDLKSLKNYLRRSEDIIERIEKNVKSYELYSGKY